MDDAGTRCGIVILTLMAGPLLDALQQEDTASRKKVSVVDGEGFYLLHPSPATRWRVPAT